MVSYLDREEKGTDVNLATHLLLDVLQDRVDAAIVVSNDSDLALPIRIARVNVPVGIANPGAGPLAGALRGHHLEGVRGHWWRRIESADYRACQMPKRIGKLCRPDGW